jgi:hypothetical protein
MAPHPCRAATDLASAGLRVIGITLLPSASIMGFSSVPVEVLAGLVTIVLLHSAVSENSQALAWRATGAGRRPLADFILHLVLQARHTSKDGPTLQLQQLGNHSEGLRARAATTGSTRIDALPVASSDVVLRETFNANSLLQPWRVAGRAAPATRSLTRL